MSTQFGDAFDFDMAGFQDLGMAAAMAEPNPAPAYSHYPSTRTPYSHGPTQQLRPAIAVPAFTDGPPPIPKAAHQRTYHACNNCRASKTKCDKGDVDNPITDKCARCRREGKPCVRTDARSKKSRSEDVYGDEESNGLQRKRKRINSTTFPPHSHPDTPAHNGPATASSTSSDIVAHIPINDDSDPSTAIPNFLQRHPINNQQNTLGAFLQLSKTLNDAANSSREMSNPSTNPRTDSISLDADVNGFGSLTKFARLASSDEIRAACKEWGRFVFVNERLFSAKEAMNYVLSFHFHMACLTPVPLPNLEDVTTHSRLLNEEPLLALTIVTIASRYFEPSAPGNTPVRGATSRAVEIHNRCWARLQKAMDQILWGRDRVDASHHSTKLRSLGTIESLMLLTEWHPRGLHFPVDDGLQGLMTPRDISDLPSAGVADSTKFEYDSKGGSINCWLAPCKRSGRMSWQLLNNAMAIAVELGIFDPNAYDLPGHEFNELALRRQRIGRLLYVYIESTCLRLGFSTNLPDKPGYLTDYFHQGHDHPKNQPAIEHNIFHWERISRQLTEGHERIFDDQDINNFIEFRLYEPMVKKYDEHLFQHSKKLGSRDCSNVPGYQRRILNFELQFARVHLASVALQAVMERILVSNPSLRNHTGVPLNQTLSDAIEPDRKIIDHMVEASLSFLETVQFFIKEDSLKYIPSRSFFRITSVSLILIKCFYMGLNTVHAAKSLSLLNSTATALRTQVCDDVHVSARIGEVLSGVLHSVRDALRFQQFGPGASNVEGTFQIPSPMPLSDEVRVQTPPAFGTYDMSSFVLDVQDVGSLANLQGVPPHDMHSGDACPQPASGMEPETVFFTPFHEDVVEEWGQWLEWLT